MSFPRYSNCKETGIQSVAVVPSHWELKRLKDVASHNDASLSDDTPEEAEFLYVDISSVNTQDGIHTKEQVIFKNSPSRARRRVKEGDIIISTVRTYLKAIARVIEPEGNLIVSTGFVVVRPGEQLDPGYAGFLLLSNYFVDEVISRSTGVSYPAINASDLVRIHAFIPPLNDQNCISSFLNVETSKIDSLVAEQRRLIELLKEKRQAVISHAVTKGLDPNVKMKSSGIEWLGDVPEHWKVVKLGHRGRLQNGLSIGGEAFGTGDPFVSYGDVYNNATIPDTPSGLVRSSAQDQSKCSLEAGDILFTRTSETVDDIGVASTCLRSLPRSTFAGFLIRFRPYQGILAPGYSTYLFRNQGVQGHFAGTMNLVTRASLSQGELRNLPICIPPLEEQHKIGSALDAQTLLLHGLVAEAERAITLLQERRTALISAAVTGKIDVRKIANTETAA